jgi:hypothetical protein
MMKKRFFVMLAGALVALTANAQKSEWFQNLKLSGYGMVQYQASDKENAEQNSFQLRLVRVALDGRAADDFAYKAQMQINGNSFDTDASGKTNSLTIRLVDLWGEWQKFDFFKVKAGQFKRPFTFENPMHPITQGFMSYSQNVSKLAGFADRTGEHACNGRDIGLQVQGDFLKVADRNWLHYQVGVFNGEGINVKDRNNRKDIIGGLWVMPVEGMRIGAFGWNGYREGVGEKNRYALSADYVKNDWTFRSEYVHSQGYGADVTKGDKADGFYALCIAPIQKNKCHVKARYDLYRDQKTWGSSKTYYEVGADYLFSKNLQLNVEYARVNERAGHHNYNLIDVELDVRF